MIIIPGPASMELGLKIAELLKSRVVSAEFKRFPDGESYIRFTDGIENEDIVIVQTTSPPQNENLVQFLLMADDVRDFGAKSITAVVPYFAYARQDKRFRPGEALSAKTMVTLFKACCVNRIVSVNSHNPALLKTLKLPIQDLSAIPLLAEHFKKQGFNNAFSVALGKKGKDIAMEADEILRGGCAYISTQRDRVTGNVTIEKKPLSIKDKDVVIFDDIISSGGTMFKAVKWIKEQGARNVYVACVHLLLMGDAKNKIFESGASGIVGTDCVPSPFSVVSVAPLIAQALKKNEEPDSG